MKSVGCHTARKNVNYGSEVVCMKVKVSVDKNTMVIARNSDQSSEALKNTILKKFDNFEKVFGKLPGVREFLSRWTEIKFEADDTPIKAIRDLLRIIAFFNFEVE